MGRGAVISWSRFDVVASWAANALLARTGRRNNRRAPTTILLSASPWLPRFLEMLVDHRAKRELAGAVVGIAGDLRRATAWSAQAQLKKTFGARGAPAVTLCLPDDVEDPISYEARLLRAMDDSIDEVVLGVGPGGELGLNGPESRINAPPCEFVLGAATRDWLGLPTVSMDVRAFSIGVPRLISGTHITVLGAGANLRDTVSAALDGAPQPSRPLSYLQTHRGRYVTWFLDDAAASGLLKSVELGAKCAKRDGAAVTIATTRPGPLAELLRR